MQDKRITQAIFKVVDEINEQLARDRQLDKSLDTVLFGSSGILDSLELVSFIVAAEEKIKEEFGIGLKLTDEKLMTYKNSPLQSIGKLIEHISSRLEEKLNGAKEI